MILIGTGGYAYEDWRGVFYPPDLPAREMLAFYAREFSFTEVNSTYYRLPNRFMLYHMAEKTPEGFGFFLKAYRTMTHERQEEAADFSAFRAALSPLLEGGRLLGVLAQFPTSFRATEANREYLRRFRSRLDGVPVAVEFRHREWITPETFQLLKEEGLAYVVVDEPAFKDLVPPVQWVTAPFSYVRFHGRNYKKWWHHAERSERYDYLYSREELAEWVPRLQELANRTEKVYVSMNNHRRGQAVINARMLRELLREMGEE